MTKPAILVEDVTVRFRPYLDRKPTLRRSLSQMRAKEQSEVVALDNLSFRVEQGEAFGLIGANGAGKSTLLRVIARTMKPDEGRVVVNGRTSTLLQLGVGFNPQLSGSKNVYLGGLAAGLTKSEVDAVYDSIVDFAELGDAIYRPMKTYSSGMFSRLAFSVSMHLDPEVLLLDEVLAVGDESFRQRSMAVMRDLLDKSGTIIFVSHSLPSVAEFCDRALWLETGRIRMLGDAGEVVDAYLEASGGRQRAKSGGSRRGGGARHEQIAELAVTREEKVEELVAAEARFAAAAEALEAARKAEKATEGVLVRAEQRVEKLLAQQQRRVERRALRDAEKAATGGSPDPSAVSGERKSDLTRAEADALLAAEIEEAQREVSDARARLEQARSATESAKEATHQARRDQRAAEAEQRRLKQRLDKLKAHRDRDLERRAAWEADRLDVEPSP